MHELIYDDSQFIKDAIKKEFPEAVFTDASDDVHEGRMSVDIQSELLTDCDLKEQFYVLAIKKGFCLCCLGFNLLMHDNRKIDKVKEWARLAGVDV